MKTVDLDPELFIENRRRLRTRLLPNSIAVVHANDVMPTNADGTMPFQQNADLFYLTGVNQEESILLLALDAAERKFREIPLRPRNQRANRHLGRGEADQGAGGEGVGHSHGALAVGFSCPFPVARA